MEPEKNQLASLFPDVAAQLRGALSNLHMVAAQLVPEEEREKFLAYVDKIRDAY